MENKGKDLKEGGNDKNGRQENEKDSIYPTIDSSFSWVIVVASFLVALTQSMNGTALGTFLNEMKITFEKPMTLFGALAAVRTCVQHFSGVVTGTLTRRFGCRAVAICGIMVTVLGTIVTVFVENFYLLIITFGVISGLGFGSLFIPASIIVQEYHIIRRSLAAGIASTGTSAASIICPPLLRLAIETYGWRGGMFFLAAMTLQGIVGAMLFFPLPVNPKLSIPKPTASVQKGPETLIKQGSKTSLLRSKSFMVFLIALLPTYYGENIYTVFAMQRALSLGVDGIGVALILQLWGGAAIGSRIFAGFVGNMYETKRLMQFSVAVILGGVVTMSSTLAGNSLLLHALCGAFFGISYGGYQGLYSTVVMDLVGKEDLPIALSVLQLVKTVGSIITIPLGGLMYDFSGDFEMTFLVSGAIQIFGGIVIIFSAILLNKKRTTVINIIQM